MRTREQSFNRELSRRQVQDRSNALYRPTMARKGGHLDQREVLRHHSCKASCCLAAVIRMGVR